MSMLEIDIHYEIRFDVPARRYDAFEGWLSGDATEWLTHDAVVSFDVFQNDTGLSPEAKFVFGFETLEEWAQFVNSDEHAAAMERFETFAENREAVLWQRASMKLDETTDRPIGDGGPSNVSRRQRDVHTEITQ